MRHKVAGRRLGRGTNERKMLRRNLIIQLFQHEKIRTTEAKAKAIRGQAEKLITLARNRGDAGRIVELVEDQNEETLLTMLTDAQVRRLMTVTGDDLEREARAISVHAQRLAAREITDRDVLSKLFSDIAPRYVGRPGGYTRIVRLGQRKGDAAQMVQLSLVEGES